MKAYIDSERAFFQWYNVAEGNVLEESQGMASLGPQKYNLYHLKNKNPLAWSGSEVC